MNKQLSVSAIAAIISLAVAVPAYALTANTSANASLNANAALRATNSASSDSSAGGSSADESGSATVGVDASLNTGSNASATISGIVTGSAQVQSDNDLDSYSMSVKRQDSSVNAVTSTKNSVSVEYAVPAKLFGFISVTMPEKASVNVNGDNETSVSVHRPWWSFLASVQGHDADSLEARIQAHVPSAVSSSVTENAALSASAKAELISAIETGAHEAFGTSAHAKADVSAGASSNR